MTARSLLTRGPFDAEPLEAHFQTVPVGKRTAVEVPEKVVPRRTGIRRTRRSRSGVTPWPDSGETGTLWAPTFRARSSGRVPGSERSGTRSAAFSRPSAHYPVCRQTKPGDWR
jgi:hypothetical protein